MKVLTISKEDLKDEKAFQGILRALGYGQDDRLNATMVSLVVEKTTVHTAES